MKAKWTNVVLLAVVFYSMTLNGKAGVTFENLFSFNAADGGQPQCRLLHTADGNFLGTTEVGGGDGGVVFKVSPQGEIIWSAAFKAASGYKPEGDLIQDRQGYIYGTTSSGGQTFGGAVFKMTVDGKFVWSTSFNGNNGASPEAGLVAGQDGNLYGTTSAGGKYNFGTVFRITPNGRITSLYSFTGNQDGAQPIIGLTVGSDGNFYGATLYGGITSARSELAGTPSRIPKPGFGTIFKITPNGKLTTVYTFGTVVSPEGHCLDGAYCSGELMLGKDQNLYGTTSGGGPDDFGTIFRISLDGKFTSLYWFDDVEHGFGPTCRLIQDDRGNFYGTTILGGTDAPYWPFYGYGTIFRFGLDGTFTTLVSFNGEDGAFPVAGMTAGSDGNLYGTTSGGYDSPGTIYRLNLGAPFLYRQPLHKFHGALP